MYTAEKIILRTFYNMHMYSKSVLIIRALSMIPATYIETTYTQINGGYLFNGQDTGAPKSTTSLLDLLLANLL